jgi:WD40 repeat protein
VLSAAFHPTDPLLATASDDGTVLVHDMDSGDLVRRIGLASPAYSVAFSPDGSDIVIGTDLGLVVNPMDVDELVELGARQAGRGLTPAECEEFLHDDQCPGR